MVLVDVGRGGFGGAAQARGELLGQVVGLLVRGLGARGHGAPVAPGRRAAIAQGQNVRIGGFQTLVDFQLAQLVQRQVQVGQQGGALDAGGPHAQLGGEFPAVGGLDAIARYLGHAA
ncbi:hypothetical protein D3C87_1684740 [compost metagenome]